MWALVLIHLLPVDAQVEPQTVLAAAVDAHCMLKLADVSPATIVPLQQAATMLELADW